MVRKTLKLLAALVVLCFVVSACGSTPKDTMDSSQTSEGTEGSSQTLDGAKSSSKAALTRDLIRYHRKLRVIAAVEQPLFARYASVSGQNFTTDQKMYSTIDSMIPDFRDYVADVETLRPRTPQLRRVHELFISAANNQMSAFTTLLAALERSDRTLITEGNEYLNKASRQVRAYQEALRRLSKR